MNKTKKMSPKGFQKSADGSISHLAHRLRSSSLVDSQGHRATSGMDTTKVKLGPKAKVGLGPTAKVGLVPRPRSD